MRESPWRDRVPSVHSSREEAGSKNAGALIEETGATPADYLFGPGIDEPLAMSRSGGQVYYYDVDGLESANLVTNSSGAVQDSYVYDAWGQTRRQTGTLANPFGYTAREFGEAGTLFYRARYYQPGSWAIPQRRPPGLMGCSEGDGRSRRAARSGLRLCL